jgi:hypothetical protein
MNAGINAETNTETNTETNAEINAPIPDFLRLKHSKNFSHFNRMIIYARPTAKPLGCPVTR